MYDTCMIIWGFPCMSSEFGLILGYADMGDMCIYIYALMCYCELYIRFEMFVNYLYVGNNSTCMMCTGMITMNV